MAPNSSEIHTQVERKMEDGEVLKEEFTTSWFSQNPVVQIWSDENIQKCIIFALLEWIAGISENEGCWQSD